MRFPSYSSALSWLYARNQFAIKLGLENTHRLLDAVGNPERDGKFLHVAGTNGKGSTSVALASMLPALGVTRAGLYTSPHLVSFRERIRVDGEAVPAAFVADWMNRHADAFDAVNPTYFEIVTALAFAWFRERDCGAVVLETGLGGRLDATNVVTPRVTAITSIGLDHTAILGDTLEAIQGEKLGIVKPGVPLVVDESRPGLAARAEAAAFAAGAPFANLADRLSAAPGGWTLRGRFRAYSFPADLRAEDYQVRNAALAVLTLESYHGAALPPESAWLPALRAARLPGRMQRLQALDPRHVPVLLDGAHNPAAAEAMVAHLLRDPPARGLRVFFSAMADKDVRGLWQSISRLPGERVFVDLSGSNPRALTAAALRAALRPSDVEALRVVAPEWSALEPLLRAGPDCDRAVFCGSLYLLGEVIPLLAPHYAGLEDLARLRKEDEADGGH